MIPGLQERPQHGAVPVCLKTHPGDEDPPDLDDTKCVKVWGRVVGAVVAEQEEGDRFDLNSLDILWEVRRAVRVVRHCSLKIAFHCGYPGVSTWVSLQAVDMA